MSRYLTDKIPLLVVIMLAYLITGCSGSRRAVREPIKEQGADYLVHKLQEHQLKFKQFSESLMLPIRLIKKPPMFLVHFASLTIVLYGFPFLLHSESRLCGSCSLPIRLNT